MGIPSFKGGWTFSKLAILWVGRSGFCARKGGGVGFKMGKVNFFYVLFHVSSFVCSSKIRDSNVWQLFIKVR